MCSFAGVHVIHALTAPAADVAAPDELALTALDTSHQVRVVSTAAAQQVAAVRTAGGPVAAAVPGADDTLLAVLKAVVRRLVEEEELLLVDGEATLILPPHLPPRAVSHLDAVLVALLQVHTNALKRRHRLPTGFHCTGAGDTMTTTVSGHRPVNGLKDRQETTLIKQHKLPVFSEGVVTSGPSPPS